MTDEKEDPVESGAATVADVFKDEGPEPEVEQPQPEPESKGETAEEKPEPEPEQPEAKAEPGATAEPPSAEPVSVPKQALLDERRKRQALEAELAELRKQSGQQDESAPDPIADPEGYKNYLKSQWESERWTVVSNKSRERMLENHADYESMEKHFVTMAQSDTSLVQKMREHHDPAAFAYETAKADVSKKEAEIEKRVIEKLKKEGKLKEPKSSAPEVANLINSPGAGSNNVERLKPIESVSELF